MFIWQVRFTIDNSEHKRRQRWIIYLNKEVKFLRVLCNGLYGKETGSRCSTNLKSEKTPKINYISIKRKNSPSLPQLPCYSPEKGLIQYIDRYTYQENKSWWVVKMKKKKKKKKVGLISANLHGAGYITWRRVCSSRTHELIFRRHREMN